MGKNKENRTENDIAEDTAVCGCHDSCHCKTDTNKDDCHCQEACQCGDECHCDETCDCGDDCTCGDDCKCGESCQASAGDCQCDEHCDCGCQEGKACTCSESSNDTYLTLARQIQADFENFRRHAAEEIQLAKTAGQASVIEAFLPCLDTFKEAKKTIHDETVLEGIDMIESKLRDTLQTLGVTKMDAIGQKYDPHYHNVIAVMQNEKQDNDIILDEYQAGYMYNGKVLRYAKVIVNKKED